MNVVTSAKIRRDIREHLHETYPHLIFYFHTSIEEAEEDLEKADILITYGEDLTPDHIKTAVNLKWIMVISAGLEKMPFAEIKEKRITVTNATGIHAIPMAEYAISMMLQTAGQMKTILQYEQEKKWKRPSAMSELHHKTLVILGAGAIGTQTAHLAKAFSMRVIGINRTGKTFPPFDNIFTIDKLHDILPEADFLVAVLPKTPETDDILDREAFKRMKEESVLINMGRGNAVRETDLIEALRGGQFHHAVLDVFNEEPLPEDHLFWEEEKITVTPHLSGISPQYQPRAFEIFEHNLAVFESGQGDYINLVDVDKGY